MSRAVPSFVPSFVRSFIGKSHTQHTQHTHTHHARTTRSHRGARARRWCTSSPGPAPHGSVVGLHHRSRLLTTPTHTDRPLDRATDRPRDRSIDRPTDRVGSTCPTTPPPSHVSHAIHIHPPQNHYHIVSKNQKNKINTKNPPRRPASSRPGRHTRTHVRRARCK